MDYLENWIGSIRNYYYFSESDKEIMSQIRLYDSKYDWIGTRQTLVCNKTWLKSTRDLFSNLEEQLEQLHREVVNINLERHPVSMEQSLTDSWGDLSEPAKKSSGKRKYHEPILKNALVQLKKIKDILHNITKYHICDQSKVLNYFFSDDLYEHANSYEIKCQKGFLHDLVDYYKWLDRAEIVDLNAAVIYDTKPLARLPLVVERLNEINKIVKLIYTVENLDKIYEAAIMFGFISPHLESKKADKLKIERYFDQLVQQVYIYQTV